MARPAHLFFDLDGTLTDSAEGIVACIQHAMARLTLPNPAPDEIRPFIGSPLRAIFDAFLPATTSDDAKAEQTERAIGFYRERFDAKGFSENRLYPGVQQGLEKLCADGHVLYIATAKRPEDALRVAQHLEIDGAFAGVFGAQSHGEREDKSLLLSRALLRSGAAATESVMIGDRSHDMRAAVRNGATPLGAGWGYGSSDELRGAGAVHVVHSPAEMIGWIGDRSLGSPRSVVSKS